MYLLDYEDGWNRLNNLSSLCVGASAGGTCGAGRHQHGGAGAVGTPRHGGRGRGGGGGRGRGALQCGARAARPAVSVGRQVPPQEAAVLQQVTSVSPCYL